VFDYVSSFMLNFLLLFVKEYSFIILFFILSNIYGGLKLIYVLFVAFKIVVHYVVYALLLEFPSSLEKE
jgi:hypothetical protein